MAYLPGVQFQPYIKPYNGSANQELSDTVKQLTQRYDENQQAGTALDIYAGQMAAQVGDGDREDAMGKIDQVRNQLGNIVNSEQGYYTARPQIAQLAAKFKGDPDLAVMMANKKLQDEEQDTNNKLRAQGHTILDFNDDNFKTVTYDKTGKKIYNTYTPQSEAMHNYHDAQAKYFDQMQADTSGGGLSHAAMQGFLQTGQFGGISGQKVKAQADRALNSYLATPEGDQQLRKYTQLDKMDTDEAKHAIQKEMIATGMERAYHQSTTQYMQDPMFNADLKLQLQAMKGKGKKNAAGEDYPLETDKQLPMSNKDNVDAAVFTLTDPNKNPYSNLTAVQKDMAFNAMNQAKSKLGPTASQADVINTARNYLHARADFNTAPRYYSVSGTKDIDDENKTFKNGNYTSRLYQDIDNPGKTMNWEQMKKKYGLADDDEKVLKNVNVSGFYHEDNPFTQGLQGAEADRFIQPTRLTVQTPSGQTKTVVAGSDFGSTKTAQFQDAKFIHEIYLGDKTGRGRRVVEDGKAYFIRPTGQSVTTPQGEEAAFEVSDATGRPQVWPESKVLTVIKH